MNARTRANALRVATFAIFAVAAVVGAWQLTRVDDGGSGFDAPEVSGAELRVRDAVGRLKPVTVKGWLFSDVPNGFRLCDQREGSDPPRCIGPFLSLSTGFDGNRFNLKTGTDEDGFDVVWADEPVVVTGTLNGLYLEVDQVLR